MENQTQNLYQNVIALLQTRQYIQFQRQMLVSLRARSEANQLRLQNEINFVRQVQVSISKLKLICPRHSILRLKAKARPFS